MKTNIKYSSTTSTFVKPNVLNISVSIKHNADTAKEVSTMINNDLHILKDLVIGSKSYDTDSFRQNNLNIRRLTVKVIYYEDENGKRISENEYSKLNRYTSTAKYTPKYEYKFAGYEGSIYITAVLKYCDTVVDDLVKIFNLSVEKEWICNYTHDISKDLYDSTMQSLYSKCINQGLANVRTIVDNIDDCNSESVSLISIVDPSTRNTDFSYGSSDMLRSKSKAMKFDDVDGFYATAPTETIIMPELIEGLFNNNIELSKSLDLMLEF